MDGKLLAESICGKETLGALFELALTLPKQIFSPDHHHKAIELLKHIVHHISDLERLNLAPQFSQLLSNIMQMSKPTIRSTLLIELTLEWMLAEITSTQNLRMNHGDSVSKPSASASINQSITNKSMLVPKIQTYMEQ